MYTVLNKYVKFLREAILLRNPLVSFAEMMGLFVCAIIANSIGDWGVFWCIVFSRIAWLMILLKDTEDELSDDVARHSIEVGKKHWTLRWLQSILNIIDAKIPRF